ncbi:MAG TPA: hypothetical protein PKZ76_06180, partial [Xanthomonadaceae bacterium]|nr:hypothetical protein [Xanthomonadaceae bacterium]
MTPIPALFKTILAVVLGLLLAVPAAAQSLNDTVRRIERETGGRILSAETVVSGNREVYRIKVLTPDGRVRVVQEPAPAGSRTLPSGREALRRDETPERNERAEPPRERSYVPRRERSRETPAQQRTEPREPPQAVRD